MTQIQMFDPREAPTATAEMLADQGLRDAIAAMRRRVRVKGSEWPYVEAVDGAWAVDDHDVRYVVVGNMIFDEGDLEILNGKTREAARAVFARLDEGVAA
jgi:hypothetical protein